MKNRLPVDPTERAMFLCDLAWDVFFQRVTSGMLQVNEESSMQLHYAFLLRVIGETFCLRPSEPFSINDMTDERAIQIKRS